MQKRYAVLLVLTMACFTQVTSAATVYHRGGNDLPYTVTLGHHTASFIRHGPHEAGATLPSAELISWKGDTSIYVASIPRKYWSAFAGATHPTECLMTVHFAEHHRVIDGIRASLPCNFFHGATLGFGLHDGQVLRIVQPTH